MKFWFDDSTLVWYFFGIYIHRVGFWDENVAEKNSYVPLSGPDSFALREVELQFRRFVDYYWDIFRGGVGEGVLLPQYCYIFYIVITFNKLKLQLK